MARAALIVGSVVALAAVAGCRGGQKSDASASMVGVATVNGADLVLGSSPPAGSIETVEVADDRAAVVVVGDGDDVNRPIIAIHGTCGVARENVEGWSGVARTYGTVIALEGDTPCAGGVGGRTWHTDAAALDKRIDAAIEAVRNVRGIALDRNDITVIGDDTGAYLALALAAEAPVKYTRIVLVEMPDVAPAFDLTRARAIAVVAADRESQDKPHRTLETFQQSKIPTQLFTLVGASHGDLGLGGARTIGNALSFVTAH